jgi:hypothetical protein
MLAIDLPVYSVIFIIELCVVIMPAEIIEERSFYLCESFKWKLSQEKFL